MISKCLHKAANQAGIGFVAGIANMRFVLHHGSKRKDAEDATAHSGAVTRIGCLALGAVPWNAEDGAGGAI